MIHNLQQFYLKKNDIYPCIVNKIQTPVSIIKIPSSPLCSTTFKICFCILNIKYVN